MKDQIMTEEYMKRIMEISPPGIFRYRDGLETIGDEAVAKSILRKFPPPYIEIPSPEYGVCEYCRASGEDLESGMCKKCFPF